MALPVIQPFAWIRPHSMRWVSVAGHGTAAQHSHSNDLQLWCAFPGVAGGETQSAGFVAAAALFDGRFATGQGCPQYPSRPSCFEPSASPVTCGRLSARPCPSTTRPALRSLSLMGASRTAGTYLLGRVVAATACPTPRHLQAAAEMSSSTASSC